MKRVLMIAFHFPPLAGSSGIQRTLRFVQHLPSLGWEPIVLTAHPRAYLRTSDDLSAEVPAGVTVERAFALDAARHLSVGGRYPGIFARPDRWVTWRFGAIPAGRRLIRERRPDVIWSTYPIATAHVIGDALQHGSKLPWVADFRDPMAQDGYPENRAVWQSYKRIEERAVRRARFCVFTTPGAARMYRERYPEMADRFTVIENGFDEESFAGLPAQPGVRQPLNDGAVTLLHSGLVYPQERDPSHLFSAIQTMVQAGVLQPGRFKIRFRAAGHEEMVRQLVRRHDLQAFVEVLPAVPYKAALEEMVRADGLLVLQAANCNDQIPAKLYEYLRAGRPIVALTDPRGDTAGVLHDAGLDTVAPLDSPAAIAALLERFVAAVRSNLAPLPKSSYVDRLSRREQARTLALLLERARM